MTSINLFVSFFLSIATLIVHPLKMTNSKVVIDDDIEVTINFFFDDFHDHIQKLYQTDITPLNDEARGVIEDYVIKNFLISIDSNPASPLKIQSSHLIEDNILQVKLLSKSRASKPTSISITNTLLLDAFPSEQENIVHLIVQGKETKMMHFSIQESMQTIELE